MRHVLFLGISIYTRDHIVLAIEVLPFLYLYLTNDLNESPCLCLK
jgi:hypothetical protein